MSEGERSVTAAAAAAATIIIKGNYFLLI